MDKHKRGLKMPLFNEPSGAAFQGRLALCIEIVKIIGPN